MFKRLIRVLYSAIYLSATWALSAEPKLEPEPSYVLGHVTPDTDAIIGAIAGAYYVGGIPGRAGKINSEATFILKKFGIPKPKLLTDFASKKFFLVDFNERTQAPVELKDSQIVGIIDHHVLTKNTFFTPTPILIDIRPWGSVCSIIADKLFSENRTITPKLAGAMLAAIISDTLNLRSPTTTQKDRLLAKKLEKIADIKDREKLVQDIFAAKSDISKQSDEDIIKGDFKNFNIAGKKVGIGVAETVMPERLISRKDALKLAALKVKEEGGYDLLFFFIVDIYNRNSRALLISDAEGDIAKKAFNREVEDGILDVGNLVSRKLNFLPLIEKILTNYGREE